MSATDQTPETQSNMVSAADYTLEKCARGQGIEFRDDKYTIKTSTKELGEKGLCFEALACQRVVDKKIVNQRVLENLAAIGSTGRHLDFCEIKLCALRRQMNPKLYLVDGQHRTCTMMILTNTHNIDIEFQAIIKLVDSMEDVVTYFEHINKCRPIHPDTIMGDLIDKEVIEMLTDWMERRFDSNLIKPEKDKGFVDRPFLCHPSICNIYRALKTRIDHQHNAEFRFELAIRFMERLNLIVKEMPKNITMHGLKNHDKTTTLCSDKLGGCFLGLLRKDHMSWRAFGELDNVTLDEILR